MPMKIGDKARRLRRERLRLLHHPNVPLLPLPEVLLQVQARPVGSGKSNVHRRARRDRRELREKKKPNGFTS